MNKKKLLIILILSIFCVGMLMGSVSASHTVTIGKYKGKLTDDQYNSLLNAKKKNKFKEIYNVKTNQYKKIKVKHYKSVVVKKVKKYHYVYKYKLSCKYRNSYSADYAGAWKTPKGYKYVGTYTKYFNNGFNTYVKYRSIKKQPYYKKVYGTKSYYTTKKYRIYFNVGYSDGNGMVAKKGFYKEACANTGDIYTACVKGIYGLKSI